MMELPDCPNCELAGALCEYHVREELAGTRLANEDLHKRIKELKGALREAHAELVRSLLFAATKEVMHPDGRILLNEVCEKVEKALEDG